MYQMAKEVCTQLGGSRKFLPDGTWYYVDAQGKEIGFKTIGGCCRVCKGNNSKLGLD
jgi:hypothetical protein